MGSSLSKTEASDEKTFPHETPISFSPDILDHLSDRLEEGGTSLQRQSMLDAHIRARIRDELNHLKNEEESVRREIETALETENLDRERSIAKAEGSTSRNGAALLGDLEEIKAKIEKYQSNKRSSQVSDIEGAGVVLRECYRLNKDAPLRCWSEVGNFKASVVRLEQDYFLSLR